MESFIPARLEIFEIYRRYCDIMSGSLACGNEEHYLDKELQNGIHSREVLNQLLKFAESRSWTRISVFEEIFKLMSRLDLLTNNAEFSRFYDFVFFICRENGQKNITVSRAVMAWRLVLAGRFPLLNDWCEYVEQNQRHNISEDTWRQVLAFSYCVKVNLEGYDPEGAWPVLVDDFVQHMHRHNSYTNILDSFNKCGLVDGQQPLEGHTNMVGVKRKFEYDDITWYNDITFKTRSQINGNDNYMYSDENYHHHHHCDANESNEMVNKQSTLCGSMSPCHVEGCLSKGFSILFSRRSRMRC